MLVGLGACGVGLAPAHTAPSPLIKPVVTAGCQDGDATFFVDVIAQGAVAFVLDDSGAPTGEKLFLRSIDAAAFTDDGTLVEEFHKTYGNRTGHGDPITIRDRETRFLIQEWKSPGASLVSVGEGLWHMEGRYATGAEAHAFNLELTNANYRYPTIADAVVKLPTIIAESI